MAAKVSVTSHPRGFLAWIIWGVLAGCLVVYGVVGCFFEGQGSAGPVLYGLAMAAVVTLGMSFLIRRLLLGKAMEQDLEDEVRGNGGGPGRCLGVMIVVWTLTESVGIFGLVARFLGADMRTFLTFIGLALMGMMLHRPVRGPTCGQGGGV